MLFKVFLLICFVAYASTAVTTTTETSTQNVENSTPEASVKDSANTKIKGDENTKVVSATLSDLFYQTTGTKFYISKISKNWEDAGKTCKDVGMELASITSQKEQLELFKFLFVNDLVPPDDYSGYWLSGQQLENGLYNWTSINKPVGCWGWLPGEPSHVDDLEHCVELKYEAGTVRLGWNNFFCDRTHKFICQRASSYNKDGEHNITYEEGGMKLETNCYFFYNVYRSSSPYEPYSRDSF